MTREEVDLIRFKRSSHCTLEGRSSTVYVAVDVPFNLLMCIRVLLDENGLPKKRGGTKHYMLNGKVYKTKEAFYKAMEQYNL